MCIAPSECRYQNAPPSYWRARGSVDEPKKPCTQRLFPQAVHFFASVAIGGTEGPRYIRVKKYITRSNALHYVWFLLVSRVSCLQVVVPRRETFTVTLFLVTLIVTLISIVQSCVQGNSSCRITTAVVAEEIRILHTYYMQFRDLTNSGLTRWRMGGFI